MPPASIATKASSASRALKLHARLLYTSVCLGHLSNDIFMSMGPVVLTFISVNILPLSSSEIGTILGLVLLLNALTQPLFGWLADRNGGRWIGAGGLAWTLSCTAIAMLGAEAGVLVLFALPFVLRAIGSSAFHPVGAMHAAESNRRHAGVNLALFFFMGQMGLALGPTLAGLLLNSSASNTLTEGGTNGGLFPIIALTASGIPAVIMMIIYLPPRRRYERVHNRLIKDDQNFSWSVSKLSLVTLIIMVTLRSLAMPGSISFIPLLFQAKGWSPAEYGIITSSFWLASGLTGIAFGRMADRFDRRYVVTISILFSAPFFLLLPSVDGYLAFIVAIAAGGFSGGSHSIIIQLAQSMMPSGKAFASGMIMGLIFGTGAIGTILIGHMWNLFGLTLTFQIVAVVVSIAALLGLTLPHSNQRPKVAPAS